MQPCSDCPQLRGVISRNRPFTRSTVLRERWMVHFPSLFRQNRNPRKWTSCGLLTALFSVLMVRRSRFSRNLSTLTITRSPARRLATNILASSAYRTNRSPLRSNSQSSSSSTMFDSNGESGHPCGVPLFTNHSRSIRQHHMGLEHPTYQLKNAFVLHPLGQS